MFTRGVKTACTSCFSWCRLAAISQISLAFTPEVMKSDVVKSNVVMLNLRSYVKSDVVKSKKRSAFFVKSKI